MFVGIALVVAYALWLAGGWQVRPALQPVFALSILVFAAHVAEEFVTGFHREVPALFGRGPWSDTRYLAFNAVFVVIFLLAAATMRLVRALPLLALFCFAIAGGVGNGVMHLLLVIYRGGYFPGAWTALPCFAMGAWLLWLLYAGNTAAA
jgi:hypothetical protein